jgi:UDP-glucose 6-dehydrogenase
LVVGACLAETDNTVVCADKHATKVRALGSGQIPIHEPGLNDEMTALMRQPIVFDGRNVFNAQQLRALGFQYEGIGQR